MTVAQQLIMIALVALTTMATRFTPFLVFSSDRKTPKYLEYLGRALPPAVFGMLVVYCFKGLSFTAPTFALPELISLVCIVLLHLAFRKMLVSVIGGTAVYLILVNLIFV